MAIATLTPRGVLRFTELPTVSLKAAVGRLSAGNAERTPAMPEVMFYGDQQI